MMAGRGQRGGRDSGFTLIELLVTLAIVGLLSTLLLPLTQLTLQRRQEQELRRAVWEIRQGLDAYKRAYDEGHILQSPLSNGYPKTLALLVDGVPDQLNPKQKKMFFLRKVSRDPFNTDAALADEQTWGKRSYASEASDPREGEDVYDVYSLSAKTGLNGVPYRQW